MKRISFYIIFCSFFAFAANQYISHDPLLLVVLMVKDEESVIADTLQPYVDAGLKYYFILDTGSTDRTIQVTRDFFAKHNITQYHIAQEAFIDFATSRNRALDLAEEIYPNAGFILMVDAEWYMHNAQGLIDFCKKEATQQPVCYFVRLITAQLDYFLPRLFRCRKNIRYVGVVHETIAAPVEGKVPADVWFEVRTTEQGDEKSRRRWIRDRDMLLNYLETHPESARDTFYLAQTLSCLKDWENSYKYYLKRSEMEGWDEENFMTWYRLGEIAEIRSEEDYDFWWPKAMKYYFKAYAMRPWRIEPLIRLGYHFYRQKEYATAYIFLKLACETPYPLFDILFVEKDFYTYHRYDLLSQCALSVNAVEIGEWATRKALEVDSERPYLYRNLAIYLDAQKAKQKEERMQSQYEHLKNIPPVARS